MNTKYSNDRLDFLLIYRRDIALMVNEH